MTLRLLLAWLLVLGLLASGCGPPQSGGADASVGPPSGEPGGLAGTSSSPTPDATAGSDAAGGGGTSEPSAGAGRGGAGGGGGAAGSTSTPDDPPDYPPWEPPPPPRRVAPDCTGVASSCSSRGIGSCNGGGCSLGGDCSGLSRSCYNQHSSYACIDIQGCVWSSYNDSCSGSSWSCSSFSGSGSCISQPGCFWDDHCEGSATSCSLLSGASCDTQPGCNQDCEPGLFLCGSQCVDVTDDELSCGSCGFDCGFRGSCTGGACECGAPAMLCGGRCMDVTSDENNCGTCGHHCGPGFTCQNGTCEDLDECLTDNPCLNGRSCSNEEGGYSCGPCGSGLTESGDGCADVDECLNDNGGCNSLRECVNSFGGVSCGPCVTGYTLDGADCVDVNECLTDNGGCDALRQCVNGVGSSSCGSCASGYQPSGATDCADVNECLTDNGGCDDLRACVNAAGSSSCGACSAGYQPDGATECADIDECDTNNGGCSALRQCVNSAGSSSCGACASGYQPSGLTQCMDVNECLTNNGGCHAQRSCINSTGSFSCGNCSAGYVNDGPLGCADVDECDTDNGGCDPLRTCVNQVGSSSCGACAAGYAPDGPTGCEDIDECLTANGGCHPTRACTNSIGGFTCGACGSGYVNSGPLDCADVNECATGNGGCVEVCVDFDGGHSCACNPGSRMELDGVTCTALSWNTAGMIQASGGTVSSASVAYDMRNLAIVVMAQTQSGNRNVLSRRYSPASGFTSASSIETESVNDIQYLGIDMNTGGDAMAVWAQPASGDSDLRANRYSPVSGWGGTSQVESNTSGYAEAPSVAVDTSGTAHVVRAQSGRVVYAQRPMGSGWTGDFMIDATLESDTIPLMKMGVSAGMAIWSEQSGAVRALLARPFAAGTFGAQTLVSAMGVDTTTHALAVADDGDALVVWLQQSAANYDLWGRRYEPGVGWHAPALIDQYDGTAPSTLALGAEGNAGYHVVWTQQTADTHHHAYSRRYVRGQGFAATVEVSPSSTDRGMVALAVAPSGDAVATWFEGSDVRASRYLVGVGWTSAVRLSTSTGGTLLYNRVAISDAGNAIVLWGHSPTGTWNLWAATLD